MMSSLPKNFSDTLKEILALRGITLKKIAELTDIPESHLSALTSGDFKKLPPLPYVRGYLLKISEILDVDSGELIDLYKKENFVSRENNDVKDRLPSNRFAGELRSRKKIIIGIAISLAAIYGIFWANRFFGVPGLTIVSPAIDYAMTSSSIVVLSGRADNFFDKLLINGEEVAMDKNGSFEKNYQLEPGVNNIEFRLKRFLGRETIVEKKVIYKQ